MRQISFKKSVNPMSAHVEGVAAFFAAMLVCCISATPLFAHGSTNVFNDAVFWFRGGKDLDGNGYMKTGEFFDDLHAKDASHDNHKMPMTSYTGQTGGYSHSVFAGNASFATEQVVFPAFGTDVVENMRVLRISNDSKKISSTNYYFPFAVNPQSIFADNNISTEYTIVSRIKMDEDGLNRDECLFKIGYNATAKQGMYLAVAKSPATSGVTDIGSRYIKGRCTPSSEGSDASYQFSIRIPTNTWVDLAVVVGNGKLRVGIATPESSANHGNNPTIAFAETPMWTDNGLQSGDHYRLFCYSGQTAPTTANSADQTCFIGSVQQLAIWGRALNDQEVMEAFGMPRPVIFRTGFDNGASTEFGGTRTGSAQTIDGLGSWQGISDTMLAGDEWTVNFNALRDEAGLAQIFSIKSLRDSVAAQIEPILNGTSLGERRVAENSRVFWPVVTNLVVEGGSNVLTIRRVDNGTGSFLVDAIELGGSLGVGLESESATNDQRIPPDRSKTGVPSAADPNPQHWPQGLRPKTGVTNLHFRVWMDPDVVNKVTSRFWTRTKCEEEDGKTIEDDDQFLFYVNGANKGARGSSTDWDSDPIELIFNPGELNGGWNDVEFISTSSTTNCRWLVDYFRFETVLPRAFSIPPPGMAIVIR
ncbi:MAG: hypothetical protein K6G94_10600 [Kiritimatiellae bacterium]|nr:hypothetical protein [Kiritimatiellia bacterium]